MRASRLAVRVAPGRPSRSSSRRAPPRRPPRPPYLARGKGFIATPVFTAEEDRALLALFDGLRVADVTDGMDAMGLQNVGLMDPEVRPLWKDTKDYAHRFVGIAVTARYVPTQRPAAGKRPVEEYDKWSGDWYNTLSPEPFQDLHPARDRARDRRRGARRRRLDRLEQHHGVEAARGGRRGDGRHRARHRRDRHREDAALLPPPRPRHPAGPQRDRVGEPTDRLRRRPRRSRAT